MTENLLKGYQDNQKPFLLVDNTKKEKSKTNSNESTQTKGVDTMKKYCYKRKDGRWEYSKLEAGYLYYAIAPTYRELISKTTNIKPRKIRNIKLTKKKILDLTSYFQLFFTSFIKTKNIKKTTIEEWERTITLYIEPNFSNIDINKLTLEFIQEKINNIKKETTRGKVYQKIVRVLNKAYITGKIKHNLAQGLEKPKQTNKIIRSPLTLEEQIKFYNEVKKHSIYAFAVFSIIVGSRREETLKFNKKTDIDRQKRILHIKGTKTENANRKVYITQEFINFLDENMQTQTFELNKTTATKKIKEVFDIIKVDKTLHELRHTCSANLYFLGAKDKYRQMQLGHSSIKITNDIYTNIKENIPKAKLREIYGNLYPQFDDNFDDNFDTKQNT